MHTDHEPASSATQGKHERRPARPDDRPSDRPPERDDDDGCHGWPLDTFTERDECKCHGSPPAATAPPQQPKRPPREDCCERILRALQRGERVSVRKPKVKPNARLAARCARTTIKDITLPLLMLILRRERDKVPTSDAKELEIRGFLGSLSAKKRAALEELLDNYLKSSDRTRECVFETRFDAWPDRCAIDWDFVGKAFADQAARTGRQVLFHSHNGMPGRGKARPWERPVMIGYGTEMLSIKTQPTKGPWPWICAVSTDVEAKRWYRNESYRTPGNFPPGSVQYEQHEIKMKCTPASKPGETPNCSPLTPSDSGGGGGGGFGSFASCPHGPQHTAPVNGASTCLDIPKTYPGGPITIRGLNFLSTNCRIRIRKLTHGSFSDSDVYEAQMPAAAAVDMSVQIPDIPCTEVFGDPLRPDNVATCQVEDHAHFNLPDTFDQGINKPKLPPGFYEIRLIVPNEDNFAFEAFADGQKKIVVPPELYSNAAYVEVTPDPAQSYSWAIDDAYCHEETSGPGSDEPWVTIMPFVFDKSAPLVFPTPQRAIEAEEIDTGSTIPLKLKPFPIYSGPLAKSQPEYIPFIVTCGITGLEVDDEDAAKEQVRTLGEAYVEYLKVVFLAGAGSSSLLEKGFTALVAAVGKTWAIAAAGGAVVIVLAAGLLWAAWAPADPIIADMIMMDPLLASRLTTAGSMPPTVTPYEIDGIKTEVYVQPPTALSSTTIRFRVEHQYVSDDEESRYGLTYRLERI